MKQFTFTDMNRDSGQILEAALIEPITLTKHGKEKLVIIPAKQYRKLIGRPKAEAFTLAAAPDEVHDELMTGLDAILAEDALDA
jgi:prevent-host-death family protein